VAVNPNDTEESIWTFLCEAQLVGAEAARQKFLEVRPSLQLEVHLCDRKSIFAVESCLAESIAGQ